MSNLDSVAEEVFRIIRSYNYEVKIYDDDGNAVFEPEKGRRFYARKHNILISVTDDNENSSINLYLSQSTPVESVLGLIEALRMCATKYNMMFHDSRNFKADIEPKDFASKFAVSEAKDYMKDLTEAMYGTSRSSYLKLESARMIVRHKTRINEDSAGARTRNIEKIFVENAEGERFLMPTRQLSAGRAMTQHFNHGGSFADEVGSQINRMAQDFSDLGACQSYCTSNAPALAEGVLDLAQKCGTSRKGIKECFSRLFRESSYADEAASLREAAASPVLVEDAAIQSLREMLMVEGKELNESMLEAVARYCGRKDDVLSEDEEDEEDDEVGGPKKRENWNNIPQTNIFGKLVNTEAWKKFLAGKLQTNPLPAGERNPRFANDQARIIFELQEVAKCCVDSTLSSLFLYVADMLSGEPTDVHTPLPWHPGGGPARLPTRKELLMVAIQAIRAAKTGVSESFGFGFRGVQAIREFEEWFNTTLPARVLQEMAPFPDDFRGELPGEDGKDDALLSEMERLVDEFDIDDFIRHASPAASSPDELKSEIEHYLSNQLDPWLANEDISSWVDEVYARVAPHFGISEEVYTPELDPGEQILDEYDDEGFEENAAREHIADKVRDGEKNGTVHGFDWTLKITDENRSDPSVTAYIAKLIRQGHNTGEHPHWELSLRDSFADLEEGSMGRFMRNTAALGAAAVLGAAGGQALKAPHAQVAPRAAAAAPSAADHSWGYGNASSDDVGQIIDPEVVLSTPDLDEDYDFRDNPKTGMKGPGFSSSTDTGQPVSAVDEDDYDPTKVDESEELTREDVLLPKNQGQDLEGETLTKPNPNQSNAGTGATSPVGSVPPTGTNPGAADTGVDDLGKDNDKMIAEIRRLAGLHR